MHVTIARTRGQGAATGVAALFAAMWFNWGLADTAASALRSALQTGRIVSVVAAVVGFGLAVVSRGTGAPERDHAVLRRYGWVVGAEFAVLGVGNVLLASSGLGRWIPVWVCAVVGLHFLPLARLFGLRSLRVLAVMMTALAAGALVATVLSSVAPSTIVGPGAGLSLLGFAVASLVRPQRNGQLAHP
jgi:hypothetical protein